MKWTLRGYFFITVTANLYHAMRHHSLFNLIALLVLLPCGYYLHTKELI